MRLIQHKKEAYWFYRFLSFGYDDWINPLFWTPRMRERALAAARLDRRDLETLDVGAGTGFTTEGIVAHVDPARVTMLDQSPHQLARAGRRPALGECRRLQGDAEALPFGDDAFDRYVSAGSIEYWPEPQRGITEAYRVLRPGGVGVVIGPVRPAGRVARALADAWMLFPGEHEYREWFERAGFTDVTLHPVAPDWYRNRRVPYAVAVAGTKPAPGPSPLALGPQPAEQLRAPLRPLDRLRVAARFAAGSLAGLAFVPIALAMTLRARWERR
ncbi:MAG TPA: methyltransferase domain-containing protein [Solirubrobacteraceae bacterium]|nr:methyltransferase domain-containing protein [Solirubrobacteraceae bacterium]